jgi:hypothetical protein
MSPERAFPHGGENSPGRRSQRIRPVSPVASAGVPPRLWRLPAYPPSRGTRPDGPLTMQSDGRRAIGRPAPGSPEPPTVYPPIKLLLRASRMTGPHQSRRGLTSHSRISFPLCVLCAPTNRPIPDSKMVTGCAKSVPAPRGGRVRAMFVRFAARARKADGKADGDKLSGVALLQHKLQ